MCKKKIYKYYRLSLDDENAVESNSITNQRQIVESHLAAISELATMPSVEAIDDGYTGTNFDRPGIKHILNAARRGEIACIIVKDFSRFGRKYLEVSKYIEQLFPYLGIRFIAVGDGYDSDTHKGTTANLDVPVRNMLNALYSKNVSKTVKYAKQSQAQRGKYIHAFAPFGYKKDPADKHRIIIDEPAAEIVRRVFELICSCKTHKQIADLFNAEGVPTPSAYKKKNGSKLRNAGITGSLWTYHTINNLLCNEQYIGTFIAGRVNAGELGTKKRIYNPKEEWIRVKNNHPAIIAQEIWDMAISRKDSRVGKTGKCNAKRILYKKVRCGYCGRAMKYNADTKRNYYACRTYRYTAEYGCKDGKYYEQEIIDAVKTVIGSHMAAMVDLQKLSAAMKKISNKNISALQNTVESISSKIEQLQATKRHLYERYKKGSLDKVSYFKERKADESKISEKTAEREKLDVDNSSQEEILNETGHFLDAFAKINTDEEPAAEIVNALVDAVHIFGKGRIEIKFSFADKSEKALQALKRRL